ncbi:hypothetical protein PS2_032753 [Malus domestica]
MKSVRTPHESPAGWTSSPLPQGPLSPIRPERQNYDDPMGCSSIDKQRPSSGVTKGKNEPASVLMEGLTANLKDIGLGGNDTNPMAVPGNSDDVRSIPSSASGQGIPSEGNSGRSSRKRPHSASGGNIRLEPLLEMSQPDVHFKLSSSPEQVPAFDQAPSPSTRVLFCADHPYLVGTARGDAFWKRLQECMHACGFDTISNILADVENLLKWLQNCMHASGFDIISNILANAENLVKIFDTPEGLISSGKMGTGKSAKKPDKGKAAMAEACMREKVREIQKNLSSRHRALGELAIPNPNFRQSRLSSLVCF